MAGECSYNCLGLPLLIVHAQGEFPESTYKTLAIEGLVGPGSIVGK